MGRDAQTDTRESAKGGSWRSGRPFSRAIGALAFVFVLGFASVSFADVQAEIEKGRAAYVAKNYVEAGPHFRRVLEPNEKRDPSQTSIARMYLGAIALAEGHRDDAAKLFETLLLDDQLYEPDPLSFPTDVINLFIDTRSQLREKLNAAAAERAQLEALRRAREEADRKAKEAWLLQIQELAGQEKITVRSSRVIASVPFGVGQFQNGQVGLGAAFLGLEAALLAASVVTLPFYVSAIDSKNSEFAKLDPERKAQSYANRAASIQALNQAFVAIFAVTAVGGIVQAHWAFMPERAEVKPRPIPPVPTGQGGQKATLSPMFFGVEGGGVGGLTGRF